MLRLISLSLLSAAFLISCAKNTQCHNAPQYGVIFYTAAPTDTLSDTMATIEQYAKGSGFTQLVATSASVPLESGGKYIRLSDYIGTADTLYLYDLAITLRPSGRVYKLQQITHNQRSVRAGNHEDIDCLNDVLYSVNDSTCLEHDPSTSGHSYIYLKVKY